MTTAEYYGFPEGANVSLKYTSFYDMQEDNYPCPSNMKDAYAYESRHVVKPRDISNVTNMRGMFSNCSSLTSVPPLDTSKVTNMEGMFSNCSSLTSVPPLDTSKVTNMARMFESCSKLTSVPPLQASKASFGTYGIFGYSTITSLTKFGGLIGLKSSMASYSFDRCPNLTYESCINILNGLYDFTGNGETPTSSQGKLKVNANFLTAVGDEISIGTNKGWTITK